MPMQIEPVDLAERGRDEHGKPTTSDRRLFMQFQAFSGCSTQAVVKRLEEHAKTSDTLQAVAYQDFSDPNGCGLLTYCEDPTYLLDVVQPFISSLQSHAKASPESAVTIKPKFTMTGRTYSIGYEQNLTDVLLHRPVRRACDPSTPWAVFYPVRRSGAFELEPVEAQTEMLKEHGNLGHSFGDAGLATDIRLAGHGLNTDDNDFIIGLIGKDLFPLSALVQRMRKTRQTSEFIESMGPFFVGKAVWQPASDDTVLR